eukprot:SAG31_NODE_72_length_27821_cov_26.870572_19_plen_153_part_00
MAPKPLHPCSERLWNSTLSPHCHDENRLSDCLLALWCASNPAKHNLNSAMAWRMSTLCGLAMMFRMRALTVRIFDSEQHACLRCCGLWIGIPPVLLLLLIQGYRGVKGVGEYTKVRRAHPNCCGPLVLLLQAFDLIVDAYNRTVNCRTNGRN